MVVTGGAIFRDDAAELNGVLQYRSIRQRPGLRALDCLPGGLRWWEGVAASGIQLGAPRSERIGIEQHVDSTPPEIDAQRIACHQQRQVPARRCLG